MACENFDGSASKLIRSIPIRRRGIGSLERDTVKFWHSMGESEDLQIGKFGEFADGGNN